MQIPAEFGDASFLSHGIVAGAGRRVIGMMESAEGGLKLDEAEAIRWAFEVKPRGEEGATMLRTGLDAWRLAVRALGGDGLLGEMLGDLSAVERGDGLLVEGRLGYETFIQALPSGDALR